MSNWVQCLYCGKEWETATWKKPSPCSKCGESKSIRVYKKAPKHNLYYEEDEKNDERKDFGFED